MREFLSQNSVDYEERNVAKDPRWRAALKDLTGEVVVPVLVVEGKAAVIRLEPLRLTPLDDPPPGGVGHRGSPFRVVEQRLDLPREVGDLVRLRVKRCVARGEPRFDEVV